VRAVRERGTGGSRHAAALDEAISTWADLTTALVVNRPSAMGANGSKPYQAEMIRAQGFDVPETLVTTDVGAAMRFMAVHGRVIYKSTSGIRSVVARLGPEHAERFTDLAVCPTQLQAFVPGVDVRVHVIGDRVFACRIDTDEDVDDYRYPHRGGVTISPFEPTSAEAKRWIRLADVMDLRVAGIDLRRRPDGGWTCFEVNPSPAFSYYQEATGQPLAEAVADLLASA
jgi:glutathione synthase/RimK-type ligase-like ATP-grasp enzyme